METLVLATSNPHKVTEMRAIFAHFGLSVIGLAEAGTGEIPAPAETGSTFEANASLKALEYARRTGRPCLADDSGLEVNALGGAPGVISSHYASDGHETGIGRAARDRANIERLLRELQDVAEYARGARFVCVMALAVPEPAGARVIQIARGTMEGRIGTPPRVPAGVNGFGYDPVFMVAPEFTTTGAELSAAEKNTRSHRARAAEAMARALRSRDRLQ